MGRVLLRDSEVVPGSFSHARSDWTAKVAPTLAEMLCTNPEQVLPATGARNHRSNNECTRHGNYYSLVRNYYILDYFKNL
eukprot:476159-Amphidinium_carterae.1